MRTNTRITTDLGDPRLIKLIKLEAQELDCSLKDVVIKALQSYFFHRLEIKALQKANEAVFTEWNDPLDSDYDKL